MSDSLLEVFHMPMIWIVAGEESGDARARELVVALKRICPGMRLAGAGGPRLAVLAEGPFDDWIAEAGVLGLWDVLRHYGYFRRKFHGMLAQIKALAPEAVLLVDYPGFNLRLAKALRRRGYSGKIVYYISPQVWAWNRGRIPEMARILDLMVCVFPFEKPLYEASGLKTVFAGHPLLEALLAEKADLTRDPDLLALLPGSRWREVQRNLPAMADAARVVLKRRPSTRFAVATASARHAARARELLAGLPVEVTEGGAHHLMQRAQAGIVCSGTATLEAAFFGLPYALIYKAAWLTFQIGIRVVKIRCLGIVNILNRYRLHPPEDAAGLPGAAPHVVKEFIQHMAEPDAMAEEALRLLDDPDARRSMLDAFREIVGGLHADGASERAAKAIAEAIPELTAPQGGG
jgi:lipid-A-disaccharide synthase